MTECDSTAEPAAQGISLDELSRAFARAMGGSDAVEAEEEPPPTQAPGEAVAEPVAAVEEPPAEPPVADADALLGADPDDDGCPLSPLSILEALLFVGNRQGAPLSAAQVAAVMRGVEAGEIAGLVEQLNERYQRGGRPYALLADSGGYRMALRTEFHGLRARFLGRIREARLSQPAIDVLAIVAYCQPISADEVAQQRGRPCQHLLSQLVRRQLLALERVEGKPGHTVYSTTRRFLALFGLESLDDLPQAEELDRR